MPDFREYPKTLFKAGGSTVVAANAIIERLLVDRGWSPEPVDAEDEDDPVIVDPDLNIPYLTVNGERVRPFRQIVAGRLVFGWQQEINGQWEETTSRTLGR